MISSVCVVDALARSRSGWSTVRMWRGASRRALGRVTATALALEEQSERTLSELSAAFSEFKEEIARLRASNDALAALAHSHPPSPPTSLGDLS